MITERLVAPFARTLGAVLLVAGVAACDGGNGFQRLPTGGTGTDAVSPRLTLEAPESGRRVAAGDSLLVQVRVTDNRALQTIELVAIEPSGAESPRFESTTLSFDSAAAVRDTTITAFLEPTGSTEGSPNVTVRITARDFGGNTASTSAQVAIGGPRVNVVSPTVNADVRPGAPLRVRVRASNENDPIREIRVSASGAVDGQTVLTIDPPATSVDTVLALSVPAAARGEVQLRASVRTLANDSATSNPVRVRVSEHVQDVAAPVIVFSVDAPARAERTDTITVTVAAVDSTEVDHVGVTVVPIRDAAAGPDTLDVLQRTRSGDNAQFRFTLADLGVPTVSDTSSIRVEVTAFAVDTAGNCGAATVPNAASSESCRVSGGVTYATRSGAALELAVLHGATIRLESDADRIADIASNGSSVFLSNYTRNRVDVIRVGEQRVHSSVRVGSQPWGLALGPNNNQLYVANSGGTNISVVSPATLSEVGRIETPNVKLFRVPFEAVTDTILEIDTVGTRVDTTMIVEYKEIPNDLEEYDYSDRPQAIGVTSSGQIFYTTKPTGTAPDGTIRRHHNGQTDLFIGYLDRTVPDQVVILGADSVLISTTEPRVIRVYPRGATASTPIFQGFVNEVREQLHNAGHTQVRFEYLLDIEQLGLSDTTYVAVSRDRGTIAFGEGATRPGRIILFREAQGGLTRRGDIGDLIRNTAEQVIGLALNNNGSIGVARGDDAYFFSDQLRLRGIAEAGDPSGGLDMHPTRNLALVSGVTMAGTPFIDVIDAHHFCTVRRLQIRDPVIGAVKAVQTASGVFVYAVTTGGVVYIDLSGVELGGC